MLSSRKRSLRGKTLAEGSGDAVASVYEKSRSERIKENMERMKKLGIIDLSLTLKSEFRRSSRVKPIRKPSSPCSAAPPPRRSPRTRNRSPSAPSLAPSLRRSSRLQKVAPVSYCESEVERIKGDDRADWIGGRREEVYTEEHEKLLGSCEMEWTLFVDGYDESGKRIYDQVKGKTCHQCRQKTLGHHTSCVNCNLVQGQFCGDCLYMRYGENVLEVEKNPSWICPVCRGICNCSLCRIKKGWAPTGPFYKRVQNLGYKSVAHYLILTRQVHSIDDNESVEPNSPKKPQSSIDAELAVKPETSAMDEDALEMTTILKNIEPIDGLFASDDHIVISDVDEGKEATAVVKPVLSALQ